MDSVRTRIPPGKLVATSQSAVRLPAPRESTMVSWRERSYRWYRDGYWATAWGLGDEPLGDHSRIRPDYLIIERRGAEGRYAAEA